MIYVWVVVGVLLMAVVAFLWWRYTSVARGARQRDEKIFQLLDPLAEKLAKKEPVAPTEIQSLASKRQLRPLLYFTLKHFERLDLFPQEYLGRKAQAEATLAYWMMHPNELQDAPEEMKFVEAVGRQVDGQQAEFFVFRFRMAPGHWAANDGWLFGLAGPFLENDIPYSGRAGAFARCGDKEGTVEPAEIVDWFIGMVKQKSG